MLSILMHRINTLTHTWLKYSLRHGAENDIPGRQDTKGVYYNYTTSMLYAVYYIFTEESGKENRGGK